MSDGVVVTFTVTLKPEAVEPFCGGLSEMLKDTAQRPGFRDIRVVRHKDNPNQVMLIEHWENEKAYQDYIAWRTERGDMDSIGQILSAPPRVDVWPNIVAAA